MNADLAETVGTDAELEALVRRLRSAPQRKTADDFTATVMARVRAERLRTSSRGMMRLAWGVSLAASLAVLLGVGLFLRRPSSGPQRTTADLVACQRVDGTFSGSSAASYVQAFAVTALARDPAAAPAALASAVGALVREQNAEGGWSSATLSARNVLALRQAAEAGAAGARGAYKRGLRYLRMHGIGEITALDLVREARTAVARLDATADRGLARSVALCANL